MRFRTEDVLMVINTLKGRLILIAAALAAMINSIIAARKIMQPKKRFVRIWAIVAFLLITAICAG